MMDFALHIANFFFYAFHTALIFFNLFGWLHPRLRKLNLISLLLTFGSWFLLGMWKGWGYCFLTDWHYQVLRSLGEKNIPSSYIAFLVEKLTGWLPTAELVDPFTIGLALLALVCSLWVNLRSRKRKKEDKTNSYHTPR
ncbi:MAG TPA: DUF2784 domain-containing protein [Aequorivita sp.]|nr:DUF2784 domain-containing protein [Aequorivita sp.]